MKLVLVVGLAWLGAVVAMAHEAVRRLDGAS
jgi:hypothetical protein